MMLAYKVHKPIWKEDWGMSKLLKRVVVRYGANVADRSDAHIIPLGVEASITNMVNERHNTYARLRMRRTISAQVDSIGWWSPDSTRNYTVYD